MTKESLTFLTWHSRIGSNSPFLNSHRLLTKYYENTDNSKNSFSTFHCQALLISKPLSHEKLSSLSFSSPMAKTLISSPPFIGVPLPSLSRHGLRTLPHRGRLVSTRVKLSFHDIPPIHSFHSPVDISAVLTRVEGLLYTLADAAVAADPASSSADAVVQKNNGWFGFISDAMEVVLKVIYC